MSTMTGPELAVHILTSSFWILCQLLGVILSILGFFLALMRGSFGQEDQSAKDVEILKSKKKSMN